eukprot:scaffold73962_cov68-Phaeocystis_antarctica.AAC.3
MCASFSLTASLTLPNKKVRRRVPCACLRAYIPGCAYTRLRLYHVLRRGYHRPGTLGVRHIRLEGVRDAESMAVSRSMLLDGEALRSSGSLGSMVDTGADRGSMVDTSMVDTSMVDTGGRYWRRSAHPILRGRRALVSAPSPPRLYPMIGVWDSSLPGPTRSTISDSEATPGRACRCGEKLQAELRQGSEHRTQRRRQHER